MAKKAVYVSEVSGAQVFWDKEWEEFYVVAKGKTKSHPSTYFTDDKQDAIGTANLFKHEV